MVLGDGIQVYVLPGGNGLEEDKTKTAFTYPLGFNEFNRMPQDAQGVHTDPDKISALKDWPRPVNREELKRFLGFAGYYRRFVEGYSKIAKPLNSLIIGCYPPKKRDWPSGSVLVCPARYLMLNLKVDKAASQPTMSGGIQFGGGEDIDSLVVSNTNRILDDSSSSSSDNTSLLGGSDTGMIYLNPQTPNWTLANKFAELTSAEGSGVSHGQDNSHPEPSECMDYIKANMKFHGTDDVHLDTVQQKESKCTKFLKSPELQRDDSVKVSEKLKELNVDSHDFPQDGDVSKSTETSKKNLPHMDVILFDACEDSKTPRLFAAMKKRSVAGDTEHRPYKCTHCDWAFKKFCNLQSHLETHTGLKPHICDICGKAYSHQGTLQQHKRLHTGERPYHCPFCVKTYIWSSDYRKHIRTHTGEKPYVCDTCGKDFVRSSDLRKHERNMHTNDKPYPCTHCGKTFNKPLSLKRHERKHLGEKPFCCPDCGKAFALASRMAEHQKIHRGVRPYICPVCSKCFTKSSNLFEHEAIHSGVRPHKCKECGVAFAMASRLVRHQYVHSGERPFSCPGCSMSFSHLATLKHHQEQTCAGRIFICKDCDKSFQCASKLTQHMLSHKDKTV
ncbi:zinc finger protein 70 [Lampris incognitus]|uniref:zinc finger protein 70 n=1 Tax=Lampris incognitus TaxID=2546036 RepID=UPI0024B5E0D0|nr:zinc finger protein 70 [Lampris incognitus]